jgi:hypothetical protein
MLGMGEWSMEPGTNCSQKKRQELKQIMYSPPRQGKEERDNNKAIHEVSFGVEVCARET